MPRSDARSSATDDRWTERDELLEVVRELIPYAHHAPRTTTQGEEQRERIIVRAQEALRVALCESDAQEGTDG